MSRMFDRIERDELAIGTITLVQGPEWLEIMGHVGLDFGCIDMMLTSIDWDDAANMIRAANQYNLTPWIRLQGYPWSAGADARTVADVLRALSIGAEAVTMSLDTPEEVAAVLHPTTDWHRRVYIDAGLDVAAMEEKLQRETLVLPLIESVGAAKRIEDILSVKGLRAIFLGMTDLSRQLGYDSPGHPEVRAFVKKTVQIAKNKGVMVVGNTGRLYGPQKILDSLQWWYDIGVRVMWIPYFTYTVQRYYEETVGKVRQEFQVSGSH